MAKTVRGLRLEQRLVNDETGEIPWKHTKTFPPQFDEERGYLFWNRKQFARSYSDVPFPVEMSHDEIGKMTVLSKHMYSQTNMLGYRARGGVRPHTIEQIGELIDLGPRRVRRFMDKMRRLGLVAKIKVEVGDCCELQWYINPIYFFSANRLPLNLYVLFRTQMNAVLPRWVVDKFSQLHDAQK